MRARIYPLALGKILKHALININREVIGLLVGRTQSGEVLEIWDAVTGGQMGTPGFVSLQEEVQALVAERLSKEETGFYIIGWYHSHPGLGIFLSGTDIETQRQYQSMFSKAVALVIDPLDYSKTLRISELKFKVFRLSKDGRIMQVPVTIGAQKAKVLESTLRGLNTIDIRYVMDVNSDRGDRPVASSQAGRGGSNRISTRSFPSEELERNPDASEEENLIEKAKRIMRGKGIFQR